MSNTADRTARLEITRRRVEEHLLSERTARGHWEGELSTSALSTATASFALIMVDEALGEGADSSGSHRSLIRGGLGWLSANANSDGGWGDTVKSVSNLSTTTLCWAALSATADGRETYRDAIVSAERWITDKASSLDPRCLADAVAAVYGKDRTFSIPILTHCALAGRLGADSTAWPLVSQLPFELAACPRTWFKHLGLPVVSYALPALIAIGQVRHHHLPTKNPLLRLLRNLTRNRTLRILKEIQPSSGGFLEAVPLTSFVTMSLAGCGHVNHTVTQAAVHFLKDLARPDGSWPIDTNLATWVTTLAVNALGEERPDGGPLDAAERERVLHWLLGQQYQEVHPYTNAAPGAWAWTDLPGGVPDADDTPGALLALRQLGAVDSAVDGTVEGRVLAAGRAGVRWLLDLQNRDGGIPTFCRGWSNLPFDRSGADLTGHALRAFAAWRGDLPILAPRIDRAIQRGIAYLRSQQREDGSWVPLWFGSQFAPAFENPVYGTARVLHSLDSMLRLDVATDGNARSMRDLRERGRTWLARAQNSDGGWGGVQGAPSSMEETSLAVHALADEPSAPAGSPHAESLSRGLDWLLDRIDRGGLQEPTPIGFYFASLWYYERLYPGIFALSALNRVAAQSR